MRARRGVAGAGEHAGEGLDDGRVELRAGMAAELADREGLPRREAVRGGSEVIASKASATRMTRGPSGIASPARPSG